MRDQAVAAHHAVGVEHHHVAVVLAPAAAEVGHVAGLAVGAALAQAVVDLDLRLVGLAGQLRRAGLPRRRVRPRRSPGRCCRTARTRRTGRAWPVAASDSQVARRPANTVRHVLVADRHDDRGARVAGSACGAAPAAADSACASPRSETQKPISAVTKPVTTQADSSANSAELAVLQPGVVVVGLHVGEQRRGQHRAEQRQQQNTVRRRLAARCHGSGLGRRPAAVRRRPAQPDHRPAARPCPCCSRNRARGAAPSSRG